MGTTARCRRGGIARPVYVMKLRRWVGVCDACGATKRADKKASTTTQLVAVTTWVDEHDGRAADRQARVDAQIKQMREAQR